MIKFYLYTSIAILAIAGCKTASKSFQKGDYTEAIELGVKKLQKNPADAATRQLVQQSYEYEVARHEDEIRVLSHSSSETKFDAIYQDYAHLQHLYDLIHQYPAISAMIHTHDYSEFLETYARQATDVHMRRGDDLMSEGSKAASRDAFHEFAAAAAYRPDDIDIRRRRDDAYNAALTRVVVEPLESYSGRNYSSYFQLANWQNQIMRTLSYHLNNDFVRFYTEAEARSQMIQPDQIMELSLQRISIGQPVDQVQNREVSKKVVVKETITKTDSVIKEYATIKGVIHHTQRMLISETDLFIKLRDPRGGIIWNDHFTAQNQWKTEFATYTGDERALEEKDKSLLNRNDYNPPREDKILEDLLHQLQQDLSYHLTNYYRQYL